MPNQVVLRANEIMHHLEKEKVHSGSNGKAKNIPKPEEKFQLNIFEAGDPNYQKVKELLISLDINTMSPVEALLKLNEVKIAMERSWPDSYRVGFYWIT